VSEPGYTVIFDDAASRDLRSLPKKLQQRIVAKAESLALDPRPPGSLKLAGHDNLYRVRVGNYRIIYEIHDDRRIVIVVVVAHRRESYRGL